MQQPTRPSSSTDAQVLTESFLRNERPKLDAALKSFYSWFVASNYAGSQSPIVDLQHQQQEEDHVLVEWNAPLALQCTRNLSKAINRHILPIAESYAETRRIMFKDSKPDDSNQNKTNNTDTNNTSSSQQFPAEQRALVERVWNNEVSIGNSATLSSSSTTSKSSKRITQTLGRTSLQLAWSTDLHEEAMALFMAEASSTPSSSRNQSTSSSTADNDIKEKSQTVSDERKQAMIDYLRHFERLLFSSMEKEDENARLVWSTNTDRQAELMRRATARMNAAQARPISTTSEQDQHQQLLSLVQQQQQQQNVASS